jgi:hypothetical protein
MLEPQSITVQVSEGLCVTYIAQREPVSVRQPADQFRIGRKPRDAPSNPAYFLLG